MKNLILFAAILMFASCQDKQNQVSEDKQFFVESNDTIFGYFQFSHGKDKKISSLVFVTDFNFYRRNKYISSYYLRSYADYGIFSLDVERSGDSLFLKKKVEVKYDKYRRPLNPEFEIHFFTTVIGQDQIDQSLAIKNINKADLFKIESPVKKITVIDKPKEN